MRKGIDSTVMLVTRRLWKLRNDHIFNSVMATLTETLRMLVKDADQWVQAGATNLAALGWPVASTTA